MNTHFIQPEDASWENVAEQIQAADWRAVQHLSQKMFENKFEDWEGVIYIEDNEEVTAVCSIVKEDIIEEGLYTPYIAIVYVFPEHRGSFLAKDLVERSETELQKAGFSEVYIVSQLEDFYEKLGYVEINQMKDVFDRDMKVYRKDI